MSDVPIEGVHLLSIVGGVDMFLPSSDSSAWGRRAIPSSISFVLIEFCRSRDEVSSV